MNNDIIYIIKESSNPTLVGKKLILEHDANPLRIEKFILTIFKDRKDEPILRNRFTYIRLNLFLEINRIELIVDTASLARFNRCLKEHTGTSTVYNVASGLPIFGVSFDKGESVQQSIIEKHVNELNKGDI